MKRIAVQMLDVVPSDLPKIRSSFPGLKIKELGSIPTGDITVYIECNFEDWRSIQDSINSYDQKSSEFKRDYLREEISFSKLELDSATLLAVRVRQAPRSYAGAPGGVEYDYTVAPSADSPAPWCWQRSPCKMRPSDFPKPHVGLCNSIAGEILVHQDLKSKVDALRGSAAELVPVQSSVDGKMLEWSQLRTPRLMPRYGPETSGVQIGKVQPASEEFLSVFDDKEAYWPQYSRGEVTDHFGGIPAITFTWELYGEWYDPPTELWAPPQPRLIVDQQTRRELKAAKVPRLEFIPVRLT